MGLDEPGLDSLVFFQTRTNATKARPRNRAGPFSLRKKMIEISVASNIKQVRRELNAMQRKQLPFATALALTRTAQAVQRAETAQIPRKIDRPTPFTQRAIAFDRATKSRLYSVVRVKPVQAAYLGWQISGGVRRPARSATAVPAKTLKLNQYGNIKARRRGLLRNKNRFVATINGVYGIWGRASGRRAKRRIKLIAVLAERAVYKQIFPFYRIAESTAKSVFDRHMHASIERALSTAR